MAETPPKNATDRATQDTATPSPFRRFPWVQLAFCVACLSMTAWTWMRYSYAWKTAPRGLIAAYGSDTGRSWRYRYVTLHGRIASCTFGSSRSLSTPFNAFVSIAQNNKTQIEVQEERRELREIVLGLVDKGILKSTETQAFMEAMTAGPDLRFQIRALITSDDWRHRRELRFWHGRVVDHPTGVAADKGFYVNTTASRFHPASVAGLVVGAMGCFIFGLYLRRWLRERAALAGGTSRSRGSN